MRASKRDQILDGVVRIIERDGMTAVTFDAVAAETGLTRGGLIYHFPSRDELILATHRHQAQKWLAEMMSLTPDPDSQADRDSAYVRASIRDPSRAELMLMLESASDPALGAIWAEVIDKWAPPVPAEGDHAGMVRFLARMAADGLWAHLAIAGRQLPPEVKDRVASAILAMIALQDAD